MPVSFTTNIEGGRAVLDEEESRHCIRVLRLKRGDPVCFVDGRGNFYESRVAEPDPKRCILDIRHITEGYLSRDYHVHIAIATVKRTDRFEWFLEKATEIGVDQVTPLVCERSEKQNIRMARSRKILVSAMKQSGRALLPAIGDVSEFGDFVRASSGDRKLIAHCGVTPGSYLGRLEGAGGRWIVLIGPEGGFTEAEVNLAREEGFKEVSLGEAVLRTETAGIVACQIIADLHRRA